MIEAREFVDAAREREFGFYAGVPCSYLKPLINFVIDDDRVAYVSSANEGDAVAAAAGAVLGGRRAVAMMQNSGLGNAVSPLCSLTWVFRIPVLLLVTLRGDPQIPDEPQHRLMGSITVPMLDTLQIPWEYFPSESADIDAALDRACDHLDTEGRPFAFVVRKGSVAPCALTESRRPLAPRSENRFRSEYRDRAIEQRPTRGEALARIVSATRDPRTVVIATTGYTGRELSAQEDRPNQLYMVGSMGCASSLGLGLSLVRPDLRVVVIDGDGAALMRMGNLATIGAYAASNLVHIVLDNETHDSTGGQETVTGRVSLARAAQACSYAVCVEGDDPGILDEVLGSSSIAGPSFVQLKTKPGTIGGLPRPTVTPEEVRARFMSHVRDIVPEARETRP